MIAVNTPAHVARKFIRPVCTLRDLDADKPFGLGDFWRMLVYVKLLRQFGAVLLLLVSFVAPAMACMAPDSGMTVEEQACCRTMKSDCGQMEMPASHGCCRRTPGALFDSALKSDFASFHPVIAIAVWTLSLDLFPPDDITRGWIPRPEHSPPKPPPSIISVLRV